MRLLVTGGAGFIGANFVHSTVRDYPEDEVTVLDALTYAGRRESLAEVDDAIRFVEGDITDTDLVSTLVAECDTVVHFAAESHVDNALDDPVQMYLSDIYTIAVNLAGLPGMSIPCGFGSNSMPVGLQIIGNYFDEASMLNVAHQYQLATDWHTRSPKL